MRVAKVSPILLSSIFFLHSTGAFAQGISEMGAAHATSAAATSGAMNRGNAEGLTGGYGAINSITGAVGGGARSEKGGSKKADDDDDPEKYDPHVTVKKAGQYSNELYTKGKAKEAAGKYLEAEQFYRLSISYREKIWGMNDPAVQTLTEKIGDLAAKRGAFPEAEKCYRRILMTKIKKYGQGEYVLTPILSKLGSVYSHEKKYSESINSYDQVYKMSERKFGAADAKTVQAAVALAKADLEQPEYFSDGVDLMKMYSDMLDKGDSSVNSPTLLLVLDTYTEALKKAGKQELADSTKVRADKVRTAVEAEKPALDKAAADKAAADKAAADKAAADKAAAAKQKAGKATKKTSKKAAKKVTTTAVTTKTTK